MVSKIMGRSLLPTQRCNLMDLKVYKTDFNIEAIGGNDSDAPEKRFGNVVRSLYDLYVRTGNSPIFILKTWLRFDKFAFRIIITVM